MRAPLLVEIGCEEIPARMIARAASELARAVETILDQAGLAHGRVTGWGGSRRLTVRVLDVAGAEADREETVVGPPAAVAFDAEGRPTPAAIGFARKQGIDPASLSPLDTDRGRYAGVRRAVAGRSIGDVLAEALPGAVAAMSFPKTMRWGVGTHRWVRPVHWVVALHGERVLPIEIFGVRAGSASAGHRFLGPDKVEVGHPDRYVESLRAAFVMVDPAERRAVLERKLHEEARRTADSGDVTPVSDPTLLDEVVDLVEWPGVVAGRFATELLAELPRELVRTTLRHHQKAFSVETASGTLVPAFLSVANTDRDPGGHVRRGNEWVVTGRLEDALFFWREDRERRLADRVPDLERVTFHAQRGSYAEKSRRIVSLVRALGPAVGRSPADIRAATEAAALCKADLVTSLVGEFPELQGVVGGLLLRAEGADPDVARAVYEHYRPAGAQDGLPDGQPGALVSVADKLDTICQLLAAGERVTGSRDPFGLRRAAAGVFRVSIESEWPLGLDAMCAVADAEGKGKPGATLEFLRDRFRKYLCDEGATPNEVSAVLSTTEGGNLPLHDVAARVRALRPVRQRDDFAHLVDLTKRVDNILSKNPELAGAAPGANGYEERDEAALSLDRLVEERESSIATSSKLRRYDEVIEKLAGFIEPVDRFFERVLVIDRERPDATRHRYGLLERLRSLLTRHFDIRELAGQAERRR
jgi:glycyl-tRNA synthetase beta chain